MAAVTGIVSPREPAVLKALQQEMHQVAEKVVDALRGLNEYSQISREMQVNRMTQSFNDFALKGTRLQKSEVNRVWADLTIYLEIPDESDLVTKYLNFSGYTSRRLEIVELIPKNR